MSRTNHLPGAYFSSGLLHGSLAVLVLLMGYVAEKTTPDAPKIMVLVAGVGNEYGATVAPALGVPGGIKIDIPATPAVAPAPPEPPAPEPPAPAAPPVPPTPAAKPAPPAAATPKTDDVPNFTKVVKRVENRRAAKLEAQYKKELAAEQKRQTTYEEYLKQHGAPKPTAAGAASKVQKLDAEGIRNGVVGGSTANKTGGAGGKALTREQGELLDAYFSLLKARIKENHVPPPNVSDKLSAWIQFYIAADGSLSAPRIVQSSGNAEFDQSVIEAFARTHSIGARPDHKGESVKLQFRMRDEDSD